MGIEETDLRRLAVNIGREYFFYRHDASGVMTYVSPSIKDMLGYSPADFRRHFSAYMTDAPGNASVARLTEKGLQGERQPPYEVELRHKDGSSRWLEVTEIPVRDRAGTDTGLEGIAKDVTARKQLEMALKASERRFKELFAQSPMGVAMIDSHTGRILELNPMFARIAGRTVEEMRRVEWMNITHPDDIQKDLDQMARMNAGEIPGFRMEKRYLHPDGAVVWIDMTIAALKLEADATPHHLCMIQDITDRKRSEEALLASQRLLAGIIDAIPVRVFWKDKHLVYLGCNTAFARDAGFASPAEIVGKDDFRMGWREQAELYRADDRQVIESGRPKLLIEEPQTTADGGSIVLLTSKIPLLEADGTIAGVLGTYMDITERKRAEESLGTVQKLESLGTLAGGLAHDLNNIITVILGNLSLLRSQVDGGVESRELVEEAEAACGLARGLSGELLTFSKGGSPVAEAADLRPVVKEAAVIAARGTSARCVFALGDSPLPVSIDKVQIARVVQNLIINAAQAMPGGGDITLRASLVERAAPDDQPATARRYVRLTVEDQGGGIEPAHLAKIFDPYFTTKGTGRGLGLSICYSIMAKHGGNISAAQRPGAGTVFTLHLPCAGSAPAAAAPPEKEKPALETGGGKVLIMDDEAAVAKVLTRMIGHLGYRVDTVQDGALAIDSCRRALESGDRFEAVVLDLTVAGGMGGLEALAGIARLDPEAKLIVTSGYADDPIMSEFDRHGFSGKLVKPYNIEQVAAVLRRALRRS